MKITIILPNGVFHIENDNQDMIGLLLKAKRIIRESVNYQFTLENIEINKFKVVKR